MAGLAPLTMATHKAMLTESARRVPPSAATEAMRRAVWSSADAHEGPEATRGDGRDVECDAFEYDVASGLATLTARPGRSVSVLTRGTPGPVRASAVKWNLRTGRIEVIDGRGEG